ncbi:MAG: DUF5106 domain-containing protein, partial [Duncaniella sp.]|nr:DUF5106 domain-containing protein [Duncaniella sp.]
MKIKGLLLGLLLLMGISFGAKADTYFPYPLIPDSINILEKRCDYLARHFWD